MGNNNRPDPYEPRPTSPLALLWSLIIGVLLLIFIIAGIIAARDTFVSGANIMVTSLIALTIVIVPSLLVARVVIAIKEVRHKSALRELEVKAAEERLAAEQDARRRTNEQHEVEIDLRRRTINFDEQGNAALYDPLTGRILQLQGQLRAFPNLHTYHHTYRGESKVTEEKEQQALLPAVRPPIPTFGELLEQGMLGPRQKQILLGYDDNGQPAWEDFVNMRSKANWGMSGFGKTITEAFLAYQLVMSGAQLLIIDSHANLKGSFTDLMRAVLIPQLILASPVASEPAGMARVVNILERVLDHRLQQGNQKGNFRPLVAITEEAGSIFVYHAVKGHPLAQVAQTLGRIGARIANEGRKTNLFVWLINQSPKGENNAGTTIRSAVVVDLVHHIDKKDAQLIFGATEWARQAERLPEGCYMYHAISGDKRIWTPMVHRRDGVLVAQRMGIEPLPIPDDDETQSGTLPVPPAYPAPNKGTLDSTTSLLESPHKRQVKEWYKALPPALQAKAQRVIEKRLANIKKVQIIKEEWDGATSGKPYEKAEEEYTMIVGAWLLSQNLEME